MCLSIVGKVLNYLDGEIAMVDIRGIRKEISMGLLDPNPETGAYVLVHTGYAIQEMDEEEALKTLALWKEVEEASDGYSF